MHLLDEMCRDCTSRLYFMAVHFHTCTSGSSGQYCQGSNGTTLSLSTRSTASLLYAQLLPPAVLPPMTWRYHTLVIGPRPIAASQ